MEYTEAYVNSLIEELQSLKLSFNLLSQAIGINKQVLIKWDWNKVYEFPQGRSRPVKMHELITYAIYSNYRIIDVCIEEYDETGCPLHAYIIALAPENGRLH